MLSTGKDMNYVSNYIILKRICENFDEKFEAYIRKHQLKLLKSRQNMSGVKAKFPLAQSMAFYLKQDDAMIMQNDEFEPKIKISDKMFNYVIKKLGLAKSQTEQQNSFDDVNHLKF